MFNWEITKKFIATSMMVLMALFYTGVAEAITFNTDTVLHGDQNYSENFIILTGVTVRVINGNVLVTLPNGGIFQIQNGATLNLDNTSGAAGNLTVNLGGATGTIDVAGIIRAAGLTQGGIITLNGTTHNYASTGKIYAVGTTATALGGRVTLNNPSGLITLPAGFEVRSYGQSSGTQNLINVTATIVNINGILNANGNGLNSNAGAINLTATTGDVSVNGTVMADGSTQGSQGGVIRIVANQNANINNGAELRVAGTTRRNAGTIDIDTTSGDINLNAGSRLIAASATNGTGNGNGGLVDLNAGKSINITSNNTAYMVNANSSGNGTGGTIFLSANGDINMTATTNSQPHNAVLRADADINGTGNGGIIHFKKANDVNLTGASSVLRRHFASAVGGNGSGGNSGNGGSIRFGGVGAGLGITNDINLTNSILFANAGYVNLVRDGNAGTIYANAGNDIIVDSSTVEALASGGGGGGDIDVIATRDVSLRGTNNIVRNWTDGDGTVDVSGRNITIGADSTLAARAARTFYSGAPNPNSGGIMTIAATGTLTNEGDINAGAWTPGLDRISTGDQSTGRGGVINITADRLINNGSGSGRSGFIHATGGLNTAGATQGYGGQININVANNFSMNSNASVDSRGTPRNAGTPSGLNRISITAGSMDLDGDVRAPGFYSNEAGGYVELISTSGDININGTSNVIASGGIATDAFNNQANAGSIVLTSSRDINIAGNVLAQGTGGGYFGGNVTATATRNLNVLGGGAVSTSGASSATQNVMNLIGNNQATISGSLSANNGAGAGGMIHVTSGSDISITSLGNYDVRGTTRGGTLHFTGNSVASNVAISDGNTRFILEATGTNGDVDINRTLTGHEIDLRTSGSGSTIRIAAAIDTSARGSVSGNGGDITINSAGDVVANANINFRGDTGGAGGSGGTVNITAGGDFTLNTDMDGRGYLRATNGNANGGDVTINAGGAVTVTGGSQILVDSVRSRNRATANNNGGDVSITGNSITMTTNGADIIVSRGASYSGGSNLSGGDGGDITLNSTTFIDLNDTSSNGYYFNIIGGNSRNRQGGDGGNVSLNYGTTRTIDNHDTSPGGTGNFYRIGGSGSGGGGTGNSGDLLYNGILQ